MASRWRDLVGLEQGIIMDVPTMAYIAPLNLNLGQQQAPKDHNTAPPRRVSTHDAPNRGTTSRTPPSSIRNRTYAFAWRQQPNTNARGEMPTHSVTPPRRETTPTGAVDTGTDRRRARLSSVTSHIPNPAHRIGATPSKLDHIAAAAATRCRSRNTAVYHRSAQKEHAAQLPPPARPRAYSPEPTISSHTIPDTAGSCRTNSRRTTTPRLQPQDAKPAQNVARTDLRLPQPAPSHRHHRGNPTRHQGSQHAARSPDTSPTTAPAPPWPRTDSTSPGSRARTSASPGSRSRNSRPDLLLPWIPRQELVLP